MVSIIILSYNTETLLKNCLDSLKDFLKHDKGEVIVVDNASSDKSVEMVKKEFPEVIIIENKENEGFAKGCNTGAKKSKGDFLFFLNSDTEVTSEVIEKLQESFSDEKVEVVGGTLVYPSGKAQRSFGSFYTLFRVFLMLVGREKGELVLNNLVKKQEVDWVSGGAMMIRKALFEKLGGFDEHFFMYMEDMELCFRVKKEGFKILTNPQARITHIGQGSSDRGFAIIHIYEGLLYFYKKHKSIFEYKCIHFMLKFKAKVLFLLGKLYNNKYLIQTYGKALKVI